MRYGRAECGPDGAGAAGSRHGRDTGFFEWACFISQQGAEKAVYQRHGATLFSISSMISGREIPADLSSVARSLDRNYILDGFSRGKPADYFTQEDADDAVSGAERIVQFCDGLLA